MFISGLFVDTHFRREALSCILLLYIASFTYFLNLEWLLLRSLKAHALSRMHISVVCLSRCADAHYSASKLNAWFPSSIEQTIAQSIVESKAFFQGCSNRHSITVAQLEILFIQFLQL